ncbi:MAG: hypothetical protein R2867_14265 [Caldilineaceae bacterium]
MMGRVLKAANPMEAVDHVLEKLLVNNRTLDELTTYLWSPILLPLLVLALLLLCRTTLAVWMRGFLALPSKSSGGAVKALGNNIVDWWPELAQRLGPWPRPPTIHGCKQMVHWFRSRWKFVSIPPPLSFRPVPSSLSDCCDKS